MCFKHYCGMKTKLSIRKGLIWRSLVLMIKSSFSSDSLPNSREVFLWWFYFLIEMRISYLMKTKKEGWGPGGLRVE